MNNDDLLLSGAETEMAAAIAAGRITTQPHKLDPGHFWVVATPDGVEHFDLTSSIRELPPERKTGTVHVNDVDSFAAYFAKHADPDSEIYADLTTRTVTAILDAHKAGGDGPGHARLGGHRLVYVAHYSPAFKAWLAADDKPASQAEFAEFIEDRIGDIVSPGGATMLEIAQTLEGTTAATWTSGHRLQDGQRTISWSEQAEARAGHGGRLTIPDKVGIHVQVFQHAKQIDELTARFRYRIASGGLKLWIKLHQPEDVVQQAFEDVIGQIAAATGRTGGPATGDEDQAEPAMGVLRGKPTP